VKELKTFLQQDGTYRYSIMAPDFVVDREERPHYEKDRFASMEANLKQGDVLFDVGAELGWQSAIYAKFVGPENMCLFEAHEELWPEIADTWGFNRYAYPKASVCGFVSNRTTNGIPRTTKMCTRLQSFDKWAEIHSRTDIPEVTLDDFVQSTGIVPNALTIDVEGAETRVLEGAEGILKDPRPLIWLSIHPEKRLASFGSDKEEILSIFHFYDYEYQYLGVDHEEHYFFYPRERTVDVKLVDSPWMTYGKRNMTFEEAIPGWEDCMGMPYAKAWGKQ
jgi:FkbM family methyltransferase